MRLLHVLAEAGWLGGEEQLAHLVRHAAARGHDNRFALLPGSRFAEFVRGLGAVNHEVDLHRPISGGGYRAMRRLARSEPFDLVHFGCGRSLLWGGIALRGVNGVAKVATRRIDYPISAAPWGAWRYRALVDHVIANCDAVRRRVLAAGVPPERVSLIHEGIDAREFIGLPQRRAEARERLRLPSAALVVSCAAALRPRKGQRVLIDAFARLTARFADAVLVLAGSGDDVRALRALAVARGIEARVFFTGPLPSIRDLLAASDVFTMASWHEGLSNACLEAATAELPLVVSEVGGLPEIVVNGETGFVVPAGDIGSFADKIGALLADEALRRRAGAAGRARVERLFTAERMARDTVDLFERLLDERRAALAGPVVR